MVQDTVEILDFLEARFPDLPAIPSSPRQKVFVHLMELLASEGLLLLAIQHRWLFEENLFLGLACRVWGGILKYLFEFKGQSSEVFVRYRKLRLELEKDVNEDLDIDLRMKGPVIGFGLSW